MYWMRERDFTWRKGKERWDCLSFRLMFLAKGKCSSPHTPLRRKEESGQNLHPCLSLYLLFGEYKRWLPWTPFTFSCAPHLLFKQVTIRTYSQHNSLKTPKTSTMTPRRTLCISLCLLLLLSLLLTSPDSVEGKIFKKKFMKKLVKASLLGKALGGKSTKIIVPLFIPMHMP